MVDINKLKKSQEELKQSITELETSVNHKKQLEGYARDRELEDMVKVALRQSKKVADKVNYLMDAMIEASENNDDTTEQTLKAIAESQLGIMGEIKTIEQKVNQTQNLKQLINTQKIAIDNLNKKLTELQEKIQQLPNNIQMQVIKKEVNDLNKEIQEVEQLVIKTPEKAEKNIEAIKQDVNILKSNIEKTNKEIQEIEEDKEELIKKTSTYDTLKMKINSMENTINHFEELLKTGQLQKQNEIKKQLETVEKETQNIQELKKIIDNTTKESQEEEQKLKDIITKINDLSQEVNKLNQWTESYPIGEAQEISYINQKFEQLQQQYEELSSRQNKQILKPEIKKLQNKIKQTQQNTTNPQINIKDIQNTLNTIKIKIEQMEKKNQTNQQLKETQEKINEIKQKLKTTNRISKEVQELTTKINELEQTIQQNIILPKKHVQEIKKHLNDVHEKIKEAKEPIKQEHKSNLYQILDNLHLPDETITKQPNLTKELKKIKKQAPKTQQQNLQKAINKYEQITNTLENYKQIGEKEIQKIKKAKQIAQTTTINEEELINHFIEKMPKGIKLRISDISKNLNIPQDKLIQILKKMQKQNKIKLINEGIIPKIINKQTHIEKPKSL